MQLIVKGPYLCCDKVLLYVRKLLISKYTDVVFNVYVNVHCRKIISLNTYYMYVVGKC